MGRTQDARTQQPPPAPPPQAWWQPALELGDRLKQQLAAAGRELHARQMQLAKNVEHARFPALTPPQSPPPPLPPPQPAAPPPAAAAQRLKQRGKRVATASVTAGSTALSVSGASSGGGATAATAASAEAAASRRAELGRSTWTLLHMLAAQLPDRPSKQQQKDVRGLVDVLTRIYPCGECARHFAQHVKQEPPVVRSGPEFQAWLCRVHNRVNYSLNKPVFSCELAAARWQPLDCSAEGGDGRSSACDLAVGSTPSRPPASRTRGRM